MVCLLIEHFLLGNCRLQRCLLILMLPWTAALRHVLERGMSERVYRNAWAALARRHEMCRRASSSGALKRARFGQTF